MHFLFPRLSENSWYMFRLSKTLKLAIIGFAQLVKKDATVLNSFYTDFHCLLSILRFLVLARATRKCHEKFGEIAKSEKKIQGRLELEREKIV